MDRKGSRALTPKVRGSSLPRARNRALALVVAALLATCHAERPAIPDGTYYGYELMANLTPDQPEACWFHENVLTVAGPTIRIATSPYFQVGKEISSSASDGGFYTFEGSQSQLSGRTLVTLRQVNCDYCAIRVNNPVPSQVREYVVAFGDAGAFELNRVTYSRARHLACRP